MLLSSLCLFYSRHVHPEFFDEKLCIPKKSHYLCYKLFKNKSLSVFTTKKCVSLDCSRFFLSTQIKFCCWMCSLVWQQEMKNQNLRVKSQSDSHTVERKYPSRKSCTFPSSLLYSPLVQSITDKIVPLLTDGNFKHFWEFVVQTRISCSHLELQTC